MPPCPYCQPLRWTYCHRNVVVVAGFRLCRSTRWHAIDSFEWNTCELPNTRLSIEINLIRWQMRARKSAFYDRSILQLLTFLFDLCNIEALTTAPHSLNTMSCHLNGRPYIATRFLYRTALCVGKSALLSENITTLHLSVRIA